MTPARAHDGGRPALLVASVRAQVRRDPHLHAPFTVRGLGAPPAHVSAVLGGRRVVVGLRAP